MRGEKKLYKDFLAPNLEKHQKGRSIIFNEKRNECLVDRYLFYLSTTENRFEVILKQLSDDFFLSAVTVANLVDQNYEQLVTLKKDYSMMNESKFKTLLRKKWPQYNWI